MIAPGLVLPWLGDAELETILFDGPSTVISVSKKRTFTGALRRAIQVRDRRCQHPAGCDQPADGCDVDHIVPHRDGGRHQPVQRQDRMPTTQPRRRQTRPRRHPPTGAARHPTRRTPRPTPLALPPPRRPRRPRPRRRPTLLRSSAPASGTRDQRSRFERIRARTDVPGLRCSPGRVTTVTRDGWVSTGGDDEAGVRHAAPVALEGHGAAVGAGGDRARPAAPGPARRPVGIRHAQRAGALRRPGVPRRALRAAPFHAAAAQGFFAGATVRIRINSSIAILPLQHPIVTAKALSTVDWQSGGRASRPSASGG